MKPMKHRFFALSLIAALFVLSACGTGGAGNAPAAYGQGEAFRAGDSGYVLQEIVRVPEYDTEATVGYGVVILMESASAPISISMGAGDTSFNTKSLIQVTLDDGAGGVYQSANIAFKANDDGSSYLGYARFEFSLPKGAAFPQTGTFEYSGDAAATHPLSFAGMAIPQE